MKILITALSTVVAFVLSAALFIVQADLISPIVIAGRF